MEGVWSHAKLRVKCPSDVDVQIQPGCVRLEHAGHVATWPIPSDLDANAAVATYSKKRQELLVCWPDPIHAVLELERESVCVGHVIVLEGRKGVVIARDGERLVVKVDGMSRSAGLADVQITNSVCADDDVDFPAIVCDASQRRAFDEKACKYKVQPIDGKGLGVIATSRILAGERILADKPLVRFKVGAPGLPEILEKDEEQFWAMADNEEDGSSGAKSLPGILRTNALPLGEEGEEAAVFPILSRTNHSCTPNISHTWLSEEGTEVAHAIVDLHPGDELTISYIDTTSDTATRQDLLHSRFGFTCGCETCFAPKLEQVRSAANRQRLVEIRQEDAQAPRDAAAAQQRAEEALRLIDEEYLGRPGFKAEHYRASCALGLRLNDIQQARFASFKCFESICMEEGPTTPRARVAYDKQLQVARLVASAPLLRAYQAAAERAAEGK